MEAKFVEARTPDPGFMRRKRLVWGGLRIATGTLFVVAGLAKLLAPAATAAVIGSHHAFLPGAVGTAAGFFELACGLLLLLALHTRWVAISLCAFVVVAASLFHLPIALAGPAALELGFDIGVFVVLCALFVHARPRMDRNL